MAKQKPVLVILAGGASSRMWPLQEKSFIKFGDVPLMVDQLNRYQALGFEKAVIVGNPQNHAAIRQMVEGLSGAMHIEIAVQSEPRGMGDALLQTETALSGDAETPIYVNQVHDVVDQSLHSAMLKAYQNNTKQAYMAGMKMSEYFPGGYLIVEEKDRITGIIEKPGAGNEPSDFVNIVAHIHPNAAQLFDAIRAEYDAGIETDDHYERAMDKLMANITYKVIGYSGSWRALKFPWHVLDVMDHYLDQIDGQVIADDAFIAPTATLFGNVYVGAGAKIFPGAAVVGPAYVGAGTIIGNNALVRNSMVLDGCEVGYTTEVARSYVASGCSMHAARVLDSVFAEGVNFSAGCTTANLRIDHKPVKSVVKGDKLSSGREKLGAVVGKGAFIGVDVMTMPGVKIGENVQIGPGTHVMEDIRDNVRVYVKQQIEVVEDDSTRS